MTIRQKQTIDKLREEIAKLKGFKVINKERKHIETKKERKERVNKAIEELKKKGVFNYDKEDKNG